MIFQSSSDTPRLTSVRKTNYVRHSKDTSNFSARLFGVCALSGVTRCAAPCSAGVSGESSSSERRSNAERWQDIVHSLVRALTMVIISVGNPGFEDGRVQIREPSCPGKLRAEMGVEMEQQNVTCIRTPAIHCIRILSALIRKAPVIVAQELVGAALLTQIVQRTFLDPWVRVREVVDQDCTENSISLHRLYCNRIHCNRVHCRRAGNGEVYLRQLVRSTSQKKLTD